MNNRAILVGGITLGTVALGVGLFFLVRHLRRKPALDLVAGMKRQLDADQKRNAEIIAEEFLAAGLSERLAAAAITNAIVESSLHADAVGDGGHSIGLFQLNDWGGGMGLSVEYRKDPRNNAKTILEREVLAGSGKALRDADAAGASVADLAAIFSRDIERPADREGNMGIRAALAQQVFPAMV
jgi:hypothetical protein